jgi:hypothetical protein
MAKEGLNQVQLAKKARVSQSTVSRALDPSASTVRKGAARSKLFIYAGITEFSDGPELSHGRDKVIEAFYQIWNNTEAHADAIARVMCALADLEPVSRDQGNDE